MHNALRRQWLRRNHVHFLIRAIIVILGTAVANAVCLYLGQRWMAGFASGFALTFWVLIRQSPPGWIDNWQVGSWGEQEVAKELKKLPPSWVARAQQAGLSKEAPRRTLFCTEGG